MVFGLMYWFISDLRTIGHFAVQYLGIFSLNAHWKLMQGEKYIFPVIKTDPEKGRNSHPPLVRVKIGKVCSGGSRIFLEGGPAQKVGVITY